MNALEEYGFILQANNMGTMTYYRQLFDYTELLSFNNRSQTYTYKKRYNNVDSIAIVSYRLHKIITEHIERELYWK